MKSFEGVLTSKQDCDPQRFAVYAAEKEAQDSYGIQKLNPVTIQMLARDIQTNSNLAKLYPKAMEERFKIVIKGESQTSAYAFMGKIFLPKWAHFDWVVCHELSHIVDHRENGSTEGHGPVFCSIMLDIVDAVLSRDARDILQAAYDKHGVKYSAE